MKRRLKVEKNKDEEIEEAKKVFGKIGKKQVLGHVRIVAAGAEPVNEYTLEDGVIVFENDEGKKLKQAKNRYKNRSKAEVSTDE